MTAARPSIHGLPAGALALADALRAFAPADLWAEYERAYADYQKFPRSMPIGLMQGLEEWASYSPSDVREKGRAQLRLQRVWARLLGHLTESIRSGRLILYAMDNPPFGQWRALAPESLRTLKIKSLRAGTVVVAGRTVGDVRVADARVVLDTRAPGRPTLRDEVLDELERRENQGEVRGKLRQEAHAIREALSLRLPEGQLPQTATIEKHIRAPFKEIAQRRQGSAKI